DADRLYTCRRPQSIRRRGADHRGRAADEGGRLSRRRPDGDRLQHAEGERSGMALCREQLFARHGAIPVRSSLLEFGFDPAAGGKTNGDLESWLAEAEEHRGSWWTDWLDWIKTMGEERIPARAPGDGKLKPIEDAPGRYVKVRA